MEQDTEFWRTCFNALLLVRNGIVSRAELAKRLNLPRWPLTTWWRRCLTRGTSML